MIPLLGRVLCWACCFVLGGCESWPPSRLPQPDAASQAGAPVAAGSKAPVGGVSRVVTVAAGGALHISGRLSLRVHQPSTGAQDGGTLLFELDGHTEQGTLMLNTVIGTSVAMARWSPEGAEIITPQVRRVGAHLDEVASALLGEELPLAALLHWVRAEPWSRAPHVAQAYGFEQLGWTVSLEGWHERVITARRSPRPDRPNDLDITVRARLDETTAGGRQPAP